MLAVGYGGGGDRKSLEFRSTIFGCISLIGVAILCLTTDVVRLQQQPDGESGEGAQLSNQRAANLRVELRERANQISEQIHNVNDRTNCLHSITKYFDENSEYQQLEPAKLRSQILVQIDTLLKQHQAALKRDRQ